MPATEPRPLIRSLTNSQQSSAFQGSKSSKKPFSFCSSCLKLNFSGHDTGGWSFLSLFYPRLVEELGMGDGALLEILTKRDGNSIYVGIEVDSEQCKQARSRIGLSNVIIV